MAEEQKRIGEITEEDVEALRRLTAYMLPDSPAAAGLPAAVVKKYFYQWLIDNKQSIVALINRIVEEINNRFDDCADKTALETALKRLNTAVDDAELYADRAQKCASEAEETILKLIGELGIVQTVGLSPTAVMSQAAVTRALNVTHIDVGELVEGKYIHTNGVEQVASDTASTNYIAVEAGSRVEIKNAYLSYSRSICGYNSGKTFVQLFVSNTNDTDYVIEEVPQGVRYIRISCKAGTVPSVYQLNAPTKKDIYMDDISFDKGDFVEGYISNENNGVTITASTTYVCSPYIAVCPFQEIEMSYFVPVVGTAIFVYDENKSYVGRIAHAQSGSLIVHQTFALPHNAYYIRVHTYPNRKDDLYINYTKPVYRDAVVSELVNGWYNDTHKRTAKILKTATSKPIITFIDDDTTSVAGVKRFHDVCMELGIRGTYACLTECLDRDSTKELSNTLLDYERDGFHIALHSHTQNPLYQQIHTAKASGGTWTADEWIALERDFVSGAQKLKEYGFIDFNFWVTPYGVHGGVFDDLARKWGMLCAVTCGNDGLEYESANPKRGRYGLIRPSIGADDTTGSQSLADVKTIIDNASQDNGWVIVATHMCQNEWNDTAALNRFKELVNYAKEKGFEAKTLNEAWRMREPIYRLYETF